MPMALTAEQLSAVEACREAARRYSRGVDRLDAGCMKSAYWPEATDDHGTFVGNAHEFVDHCMVSHTRWAWTMHAIQNHTVDLDSDGFHARGEIYNVSYLQDAESEELAVWFGRYLDRYERRGHEWRIIERVCVHEGDRLFPDGAAMPIPSVQFRQGSFDRPAAGRPVGP
jgi:hypothetical protein